MRLEPSTSRRMYDSDVLCRVAVARKSVPSAIADEWASPCHVQHQITRPRRYRKYVTHFLVTTNDIGESFCVSVKNGDPATGAKLPAD